MNQIITIAVEKIGNNSVQTVNARDLHAFLESGKDFSSWMKERISQYGFVENQDFVIVSPEVGENLSGGRPRIDYHISTDMAKELSMVERNTKGKEARQYFIECERVAQAVPIAAPPVTMHPAEAAAYAIGDMYKHLRGSGIEHVTALSMAADAAFRRTGVSLVTVETVTVSNVRPIKTTADQKSPLPFPTLPNKTHFTVIEFSTITGRQVGRINAKLTRRGYQGRDRNGQYMALRKGEKFVKVNGNSPLMWSKDVLTAR